MNLSLSVLLVVGGLQAAQGPPAQVTVEPSGATVEVGQTQTFTATVVDSAGRTLADVPIRWVSTDAEVIRVDREGRAAALRPGEARVAAMAAGAVGFADVQVPQLPPSEIEVDLLGPLATGISAPLRVMARTRLGDVLDEPRLVFESSDPTVARVDGDGRVWGLRSGTARIRISGGDASAEVDVQVDRLDDVDWSVTPEDMEVRTGDVIRFRVQGGADAPAVRPLWTVGGPDARIELEGTEGVFVAEAPGTYRVTAQIGVDRATSALVRVSPREYDSRLLRVGRGAIDAHHSGDAWVFEGVDGRDYAYIGTFMYDWAKVFDVTEPAQPVLTDSVQLDARRINDVKIHPSRPLGILTREGASSRRNGIVLLDLSTPAHPRVLSEYQETVTGGVHNVWIDGEHDLVYACHNGTSDLHIIDISDPENPLEVGRWGLDKQNKTLHDAIIQDGYAYLSYWDDGLIILDVGAGSHGGTPTEPVFVSQFRYPTGNTHVAWRHGNYVFVGDEIFPDDWNPEKPIEARGYIHVVDVSDMENPREVAKYEVPEAGVHNVWVEDDRLYVGYYQAGLRVVDISGELRGDLYAQGREVARMLPIDEEMVVPNWPMTWGAQLFNGNLFAWDMNSGLWVTRLDEREVVF